MNDIDRTFFVPYRFTYYGIFSTEILNFFIRDLIVQDLTTGEIIRNIVIGTSSSIVWTAISCDVTVRDVKGVPDVSGQKNW